MCVRLSRFVDLRGVSKIVSIRVIGFECPCWQEACILPIPDHSKRCSLSLELVFDPDLHDVWHSWSSSLSLKSDVMLWHRCAPGIEWGQRRTRRCRGVSVVHRR